MKLSKEQQKANGDHFWFNAFMPTIFRLGLIVIVFIVLFVIFGIMALINNVMK